MKKMMISEMSEIKIAREHAARTGEPVLCVFDATAAGIYNESRWGDVTVTKEGYSSSRFPGEFCKWKD